MANIIIDQFSLAAKPIEMRFQGQSISNGTAFIWQAEQQMYLITNWHNVTGINPLTKKHLSTTAAEPDIIAVYLDNSGALGTRSIISLPLRDGHGNPLWFEHANGCNIDVIALPLIGISSVDFYPINVMPQHPMRISIGLDAFILGYPFGLGVSVFPIWKRASIASEPDIPIKNLPYFAVDTASRPGMSGAPVILRSDSYQDENGGFCMHTMSTRFIGIYSGRIGADNELQAQLGIVWKAEVIEQIISSACRGKIPLI